jgi:hypothetical protein
MTFAAASARVFDELRFAPPLPTVLAAVLSAYNVRCRGTFEEIQNRPSSLIGFSEVAFSLPAAEATAQATLLAGRSLVVTKRRTRSDRRVGLR